jgi:hypothetical protein
MRKIEPLIHLFQTGVALGLDALRFIGVGLRSQAALAAENLFLRKQLARSREGDVQPRQASEATRGARVQLARCCAGQDALLSSAKTSSALAEQG